MKFALLQCNCITAHSLTFVRAREIAARSCGILSERGHRSDPQREEKMLWGHWSWGASAASSDRANEAICNGILCGVRLQKGYQRPNKLSAAGLRPAHHCTILDVSE